MVYFSYYQEYPIYEAAEGGYYYAGNQLIETKRISKRQAKKILKQYKEELVTNDKNKYDWSALPSFKKYGLNKEPGGYKLYKGSKYIGNGEYYIIEKKKGSHESGCIPYC